MNVSSLLNALIYDDLPRSLEIFLPELILCGTILVLLLVRLFSLDRLAPPSAVAMIGTLIAFVVAFAQFMIIRTGPLDSGALASLYQALGQTPEGAGTAADYFTGLLAHNAFTMFFRLGLLVFLVLMIGLTTLTGIPDDEDGPDFYTLLLGATVGMMIAASANHLLMLFFGVEMMSVPSYAMVGFLKGKRKSSEAALKYVVYGAGAAGIMLYGVSLLSGLLGTANLPELAERLAFLVQGEQATLSNPTICTAMLGVMMVLVGLAFKLSLFPFHFWCPDAFEGAAAEVGGFLSIASKAAAFALLVRFVLALAVPAVGTDLSPLYVSMGIGLGFVAALSMTYGNLAAYTQSNVKRMLAYSTIAHAGYMLMAVAAMLVLLNGERPADWSVGRTYDSVALCLEGLMYYLVVYLFMNLAAFAVVALIRNEIYSEEIADYNGLINQRPATKVLCVCMAIAMFSLVGMPPFGGFFAKLIIFMAVFKAGFVHWSMWVLLAIAGANTVFSLFYYLRVLKAMLIGEAVEGARIARTPAIAGAYVVAVTVPIVLLGMSSLQDGLSTTARQVAQLLLQ